MTVHENLRRSKRRFLHYSENNPNSYIWGIGEIVSLDKEESFHASNVLRLEVGEVITLFDPFNRAEYIAEVVSVGKDMVTTKISDVIPIVNSSEKISVLIGLPSQKIIEFLVEKFTELGVDEVIFFTAEKTEVKFLSDNKWSRLLKIRDAALKQSRSTVPTRISLKQSLEDALDSYKNKQNISKIACLPSSKYEIISHLSLEKEKIIAIGPESGFSEKEESLLEINGFCFITLGSNILRVETAGILAVGLIQEHGRKST